jgi:hypothetical protein
MAVSAIDAATYSLLTLVNSGGCWTVPSAILPNLISPEFLKFTTPGAVTKVKSATLPDIRSHQFVLTPGRYVGTEDLENEEDPFEDRFPQLTRKLVEHFKESNRLQDVIVSKLNEVGYE